jgi:hypothetical protein
MIPNFALSLSLQGIRLVHRAAGGWTLVGEVPLDAPDLGAALATLRKTGIALDSAGFRCKILIPNDQIRYIALDTTRATEDQVRAALAAATPIPLEDLVYDTARGGGRTHIAAVARETLAEAEAFAVEHRFQPVAFAGVPEPFTFPGEVFFGPTRAATGLLPPGEQVVRDSAPVIWQRAERRPLPPPPSRPPGGAGDKVPVAPLPEPAADAVRPQAEGPSDPAGPRTDQAAGVAEVGTLPSGPVGDTAGREPVDRDPAGQVTMPVEPRRDIGSGTEVDADEAGPPAPESEEAAPSSLPQEARPAPGPGPLPLAETPNLSEARGDPVAGALPPADPVPASPDRTPAMLGGDNADAAATPDLAGIIPPETERPPLSSPEAVGRGSIPADDARLREPVDASVIEDALSSALKAASGGVPPEGPAFASRLWARREPSGETGPTGPVVAEMPGSGAPEPVFRRRTPPPLAVPATVRPEDTPFQHRGRPAGGALPPGPPTPPTPPTPPVAAGPATTSGAAAQTAPVAGRPPEPRDLPATGTGAPPGTTPFTGWSGRAEPQEAATAAGRPARIDRTPPAVVVAGPSGPVPSDQPPAAVTEAPVPGPVATRQALPPAPPAPRPADPAPERPQGTGPRLVVNLPRKADPADPPAGAGVIPERIGTRQPAPVMPLRSTPPLAAPDPAALPVPAPVPARNPGPVTLVVDPLADPARPVDRPFPAGPAAPRRAGRRSPILVGAILTLILIAALALVAWWATGLPSGLAGLLGRDAATEAAAAAQPPAVEAAPAVASGGAPGPDEASGPLVNDALPNLGTITGDTEVALATPVLAPPSDAPAPPEGGLDQTAEAAAAVIPGALISPAEAERIYAATGVWLRAPRLPLMPRPETLTAGLPAADPGTELLAAPGLVLVASPDAALPRQVDPPPPASRLPRDGRGLILATAEGTLLPSGIVVFAASPPLIPPTRTGTPPPVDPAASAAALALADQIIAAAAADPALAPLPERPALRPLLRPAAILARAAVPAETADLPALPDPLPEPAVPLSGATAGAVSLAGLRPAVRPLAIAPEAALPPPAPYDGLRPLVRPQGLAPEGLPEAGQPDDLTPILAPDAPPDVSQALAAIVAASPDDPLAGATRLAVATARLPEARPRNMDRLIASAQAAAARGAEPAPGGVGTAALAAEPQAADEPEAATELALAPDGPIPGGVAQAATFEDVMRLRDINLIGVFGSNADRRALVRMPNGNLLRVEVGDALDGGQVASIGDNSLAYVKSGRTITLEVPGG